MNEYSFKEKANFIWSLGGLLRGDYKPHEFGKVILPLTVLRRLDCVLNDTKDEFIRRLESGEHIKLICHKMGLNFHNTSKFCFENLKDDANNIALNMMNYINGFSDNAKEILDCISFNEQIDRLEKANLLYMIITKFGAVDLHPDRVSNLEMGYIFEELIRRFSEQSNEDAGEHFSPREVIRLMVNLLFIEDTEILTKEGIVRTLYDPAAGTGGMLSVAQEYLHELNPTATLNVFGQELNQESYAICKADMMIKGENASNIHLGNSFSQDGLSNEKFDYMMSNPPFGVDWKKVEFDIKTEYETLGFAGRFGAGLPRIDNGSFLFLQHMISKMKTDGDGSRIAVVYNGGTLFVADHASGENNIRRWIIENDWLEAIVAIPDHLFYNVKIFTYIWIISNKKNSKRKGKVQLVDATEYYEKMTRNLGVKRNKISTKQIEEITKLYSDFKESDKCKIVSNDELAFKQITIENPQRLNFSVSESRLEMLFENKSFHTPFNKISNDASIQFIEMLKTLPRNKIYKGKKEFKKDILTAMKVAGLNFKIPNTKLEKIMFYLSESDPTAEIYLDAKGEKKPNFDERIIVTVPADVDIAKYFEREFKVDYPDAWYEEDKIKLCYLISFKKYFFKYRGESDFIDLKNKIKKLGDQINHDHDKIYSDSIPIPHTSYKSSQNEWIGKVPVDWNVKRFKNLTDVMKTGHSLSVEFVDEEIGVPLLSAQNIHNGELDLSRYNYVSSEFYEKFTENVVPQKGDLLQVRVGNQNTMAETCIVNEDFKYAVYSSAAHIRVKSDVCNEYIKYLCNSSRFRDEATMIMKVGVDIANLNITDLANIKVPVPPFDEQVRIAKYLNAKTKEIDFVIGELEQQIQNLKEYKRSLVAKCVTGKIQIPDMEGE